MQNPFKNDPFAVVYRAFNTLYTGKECVCYLHDELRDPESGEPVFGLTNFGDDGKIRVYVSAELSVSDATEVLAHELAHVAVGIEHKHDEEWEKEFENIFLEYTRIFESGDY